MKEHYFGALRPDLALDVWPGDVWTPYNDKRTYRFTGLGMWERIK